jgi:DNA polymerase
MSGEQREEAAAIARAARRLVERERALGGGELLAAGVARAQRRGDVAEVAPSHEADAFALTPPEPAPARAARRSAAVAASETARELVPLPPFADDLFPSAMSGAREGLLADSLPVLDAIATDVRGCEKCGLCSTRTNAVPGTGSAASGIVFVGEAPGADEDAQGEPFVGRAGQLLTEMIRGMHERKLIPGVPLTRQTVYICNVLKCRPPENRNPLPHEIESCSPHLMRQLEVLKPRVICCLGKFAAELLLGVKGSVGGMRGRTYRWRGAKLIVTYHPAYLLRSPSQKREVWNDLQRLAQEYLTD